MARINVIKDLSGVKPRVQKMTERGQYAFINQVHADMNNYVPMLTGDLRNQSSMSLDAESITYHAPYARYQFYKPYINYTTPGTGPRWDNKAKSIHGRSWERVIKRAMR